MENNCLKRPLIFSSRRFCFVAQAIGEFDNAYGARVGLLIALFVGFAALWAFHYDPMCWALDAQRKRTAKILLFLPADMIERLPAIREFVAQA